MNFKQNIILIGNVGWMVIQYFMGFYTLYSTILFIYSLFTNYLYFENKQWCYYCSLVIFFSLITTIGFNFIYTYNFVRWLVTYVGTGYDIRDIFIFTKNKSPLTIAMDGSINLKCCDSCKKCENDCQCFAFCITFMLFSALKIVDFFSYTNSSLIMFYVMGRSAKVFDLFGVDIPQDPKIQTILRKMSFTVLISLLFMDIPQAIVSIYSVSENGKVEFTLSEFTTFTSIKNSASLTILRIGISILFSFRSFIKLYFVDTKLAVRDSQLKLLG
jgi:hypothetical protein